MPQAIWNGATIAQASDDAVEVVEGNVYFPLQAVHQDYLQPSDTTSQCPWKGTANYFDVVVDGKRNRDCAWVYRQPFEAARQIKDHVAFWRGVEVEK